MIPFHFREFSSSATASSTIEVEQHGAGASASTSNEENASSDESHPAKRSMTQGTLEITSIVIFFHERLELSTF